MAEVSIPKSDVEELPAFRREWIDQVKEMIKDNKSMVNAGVILRVARPLLNVKPEFYIPQVVSLGPYHHWRLQKDSGSSSTGGKMSTAEMYKVKSAATLSQKLRDDGKSFDDIVKRIKGMQLDIQRFYDWPISEKDESYSQDFALMMAVDSYFLLDFLFGLFGVQQHEPPAGLGSLTSDDDMITTLITLQDFNRWLYNTYTGLCPFDQGVLTNYSESRMNQIRQKEPHLLGCMHSMISPFLQMKSGGLDNVPNRTLCEKTRHFLEYIVAAVCGIFITHPSKSGQRDFLNAYSAEELGMAGIKFKSFSSPREEIRFDKYSDTLYLPRIRVTHIQTEVFLRNMLALEFNDPARRNTVTRYVGLMDGLINTQNDVRVLRDYHVIRRPSLMLTDYYIAKMWDGMCQPFFTGHQEPPEELKKALEDELILKYYKSRIKSVVREFRAVYLSRPWKIIALFIGTCVLGLTVTDVYCDFHTCNKSQ